MLDALAYPFVQRALAAGVIVGLLGAYYGVFVVQRGLSFFGSGLAHAAFGGVALGVLLDAEPLWVALPFTVAVALAIVFVRERTPLGGDTAIGIFFAVAMALGIVFLSMSRRQTTDTFAYLFGSILAVSGADLIASAVMVALALLTIPLWGRWAYATFDRELALADRLAVSRDDYLLAVCLALTVVVAVKVVGILLVSAFLVIPAATARLLAPTFVAMTLVSLAVGALSAVAGLWGSYVLDLPSGAAIILLQAALFLAACLVRPFLRAIARRPLR